MKYLKERKMAQIWLVNLLGFAPKMEDIIPLESSGSRYGLDYVMFTIKYHEDIIYRVTTGSAEMEKDGKVLLNS